MELDNQLIEKILDLLKDTRHAKALLTKILLNEYKI